MKKSRSINTRLLVKNYVNGKQSIANNSAVLKKYNPHNGKFYKFINVSVKEDINLAVNAAERSFSSWSRLSPIARGKIIKSFVKAMEDQTAKLTKLVSLETGKSMLSAASEVSAAILQGDYFAAEGMKLHGKSLTSSDVKKTVFTIRVPHGVVGLIVPANTPIANIAWKIFPALICGNSIILKASEDAPELANEIAKIATKSGLPKGLINVIHGDASSGKLIVEHPSIKLISFTGSSVAGKEIAKRASKNLKRISLELGGKNPFVVTDDCDLDKAIHWAIQSAFSNAGQRCAAGSRIIVFSKIYDEFKSAFIKKMSSLKLGIDSKSDLGPVINKKQFLNILHYFNDVKSRGGHIEFGGKAAMLRNSPNGYYITPTLISGLPRSSKLYDKEVFGPVTHIEMVNDLQEAINVSNNSEYGLTASIHTTSISKALKFTREIRCGFVNVNLGTFGSEPHFPFGGFGLSGNGTREPGAEALDVYSELKNISISE